MNSFGSGSGRSLSKWVIHKQNIFDDMSSGSHGLSKRFKVGGSASSSFIGGS
jgi:hypothetical protein